MSFSRLALRLAAVEALCPSAAAEAGPWPTWAQNRVYDSRIMPISDSDGWRDFLASVQNKPLLCIYTEEQETSPTDGEYPADREIVDLYVEIMIASGATLQVDGQEIGALAAVVTDSQIEATLDMIEQQVRNLLDPQSQAAPPLMVKVAWELHHVKSVPMRDAENRLSRQAARTVCLRLRVKRTEAFAHPNAAPGDISALPQPLRAVALALEPTSPAGQLLRQIAMGQPPAPKLTPLDDIRIASNLNRGVAPQNFNVGKSGGPDFISDVALPREPHEDVP